MFSENRLEIKSMPMADVLDDWGREVSFQRLFLEPIVRDLLLRETRNQFCRGRSLNAILQRIPVSFLWPLELVLRRP